MSQDTEIPESSEGAQTTEITRVVEAPDGDPADEPGTGAQRRGTALHPAARRQPRREELATRPPRAKLPRVTLALTAGILVAAGFVGGVLVQKHLGGSGSGARASSLASSFAAAARRCRWRRRRLRRRLLGGIRRRYGGLGSGGSSISGSITVVSGNTLYVTASNGTVYTVTTSGSTTVKVSSTSSLSQLKPGQTVTISGTQGSGGTVTATTITAGN